MTESDRARELIRDVKFTTDDGVAVHLGDEVWCNAMRGGSVFERPTKCRLTGVYERTNRDGEKNDWPWRVEYLDREGKRHAYNWAHIYSTRDAAVIADPWPEIQLLRRRVAELERQLEAEGATP